MTTQSFDLREIPVLRPQHVDKLCTGTLPQDGGDLAAIRELLCWHRLLQGAAAELGIAWHIEVGVATSERADLTRPMVCRALTSVLVDAVYAWQHRDPGERS